MRLAVLDTETTGVGPEDQIVELAALIMRVTEYVVGGERRQVLDLERVFQTLIRPTVPVSPEARAAHHLTDEQLMRAPLPGDLMIDGHVDWLMDPELVLVAHNLSFDAQMLRQTLEPTWELLRSAGNENRAPWGLPPRGIDTLRCARHLWPEGRHGNQVMRYRLNLDVRGVDRLGPPHRALPDCVVTLALLREMLKHRTVDELLELSVRPVLQVTCQIGQWRGRPWAEVDRGMLRWILQRDFDEDVRHTARHWLNGGAR